jgi:hypothetical protein
MGGPPDHSNNHGGYEHMLAKHSDLGITAEQRLRFVTLLSRAADDAGLPADPELRAALMGLCRMGHPPRARQLAARRKGRGARAGPTLGLGRGASLHGKLFLSDGTATA